MKHRRSTIQSAQASMAAVALIAALGLSTEATEPYVEFLDGLQQRGYGELSVAYLNSIREREDLPKELREVFDLELAQSFRIAAAEAGQADISAKYLADAYTHLERFSTEHPGHPAAASVIVEFADLSIARGNNLLSAGKATLDQERRAAIIAQARAAFEEGGERLTLAIEAFHAQLLEKQPAASTTTSPRKTTKSRRLSKKNEPSAPSQTQSAEAEAIEAQWLDARLKLATVEYQIADTYEDREDPARLKLLQNASAAFDAVFQDGRATKRGMYAHLWHGKVLAELGDSTTAMDVFDEVLVIAPRPGEPAADELSQSIFAEAERGRLRILAADGKIDEMIAEAEHWLKANDASRRSDEYQGVALEFAQALIARAEELQGSERRKMMQTALVRLSEIVVVPSRYQAEAILLRSKHTTDAGSEARTLNEALAIGDAATSNGIADEAITNYRRAVELAGKASTDQALTARYKLARSLYDSGETAEALEVAESLAREHAKSAQAAPAATVAMDSVLKLYASGEDRDKAESKLVELGTFIIQQWPARSEADNARIMLARLFIVRGEIDRAIAELARVNATSERRPAAMQLAAQAAWRAYQLEKQRPAEERSDERVAAQREKAMQLLASSLDALGGASARTSPPSEPWLEAQLLMAEAHADAQEPQQAAEVLKSILSATEKQDAVPAKRVSLRASAMLARTYLDRKDFAGARELAGKLIETADNEPVANGVLLELAAMLKTAAQPEAAEVTPPPQGFQVPTASGATAERTANSELYAKLMHQLAGRQLNPTGRYFVAEGLNEIGAREEARSQYQQVVEMCAADAALAKDHAAALARSRLKLSHLLLSEGKFEEAVASVDKLLEKTPQSFELLLQKGRILQAWAGKDTAHYPEAIEHWSKLRTQLQRIPKRPPEYYEVAYNVADCLVEYSLRSGDKSKAQQAEQVLKATLVLNPQLNGQEMVSRFQVLIERSRTVPGNPRGKTVSTP